MCVSHRGGSVRGGDPRHDMYSVPVNVGLGTTIIIKNGPLPSADECSTPFHLKAQVVQVATLGNTCPARPIDNGSGEVRAPSQRCSRSTSPKVQVWTGQRGDPAHHACTRGSWCHSARAYCAKRNSRPSQPDPLASLARPASRSLIGWPSK